MSLWYIPLFPALAALVALAIPSNYWRPLLLPLAAAGHLALVLIALGGGEPGTIRPGDPELQQWIRLDAVGRLVLLMVSVVFLLTAVYALGYLHVRAAKPNRILCSCLLACLSMMSLVTLAQHLGFLWVAIEATTLSTAPVVFFNRTPRSLEATWKYLMVCSVGIALALLGSFFLAYAALVGGAPTSLLFSDLLVSAPLLSRPWLHAAFVLLLVGYGTKMGLAPMHTWKPDAYGEAPGVVGALLAGGMTSCAFLAVLRVFMVVRAAGQGEEAGSMLIFLGLLSMGLAGVFMVGQRDFKRMLAYSSVEHMGILAIGVGIGGAAIFSTMFHMVGNGLAKCAMFLSAGNIHRAYESKSTDEVQGALRRLPVSAALFLTGFFAVTGAPPFCIFHSEFGILSAAFSGGHVLTAVLFLVFMMLVFVGMGASVLTIVQGRVPARARLTSFRDRPLLTLPIVVSVLAVLGLGLGIPEPLAEMMRQAAAQVEGLK